MYQKLRNPILQSYYQLKFKMGAQFEFNKVEPLNLKTSTNECIKLKLACKCHMLSDEEKYRKKTCIFEK